MSDKRIPLTILAPLAVGLVILITLTIFSAFLLWTGISSFEEMLIETGSTTLTATADLIAPLLHMGRTDELHDVLSGISQNENIVRLEVRNAIGRIIATMASEDDWKPEREDSQKLAVEALAENKPVHLDVGEYLMMSGPVGDIGTLELIFDKRPIRESLIFNQRLVFILAPTMFLLVVGVVALVARRVSSSFLMLGDAVHQIGRGDLDAEIPIFGTREIALLGAALRDMSSDLKALYRNLERQVSALERRAKYLETTAEIARRAALALDLQTLLPQVVDLVSQRLEFYHTGIFLIDATGEWAVLQAASSEGGRRMLAREHKLRVGQQGIVGFVTGYGQHRIALDVGEDAVYFDNPDLPDTHSEIALPLRVRGSIIGALDVQSKKPGAFSDEDVAVLQTLADQVAMAISNARLFQQTQESLRTIRQAYGEMSREAWVETLRSQANIGYYCDTQGVQPIQKPGDVPRQAEGQPTLSIPITVRDQKIGVVNAHKADKGNEADEWTSEEINLLKALVEQLGVALESARLYQDAQSLAARERLISDVTTHVRETLDIETMLKTAVQDVRQALNLPEVTIRLGVPSSSSAHSNSAHSNSAQSNGDGRGKGEEDLTS